MKVPFRHALANHPLTRKLAIVTAIKFLGLMAIWWAFFSGNGTGGREHMTPDRAAAAILHPRGASTERTTGPNGAGDTNGIINATQQY